MGKSQHPKPALYECYTGTNANVCSVCQYKLMVLHTNAHNYKQRVAIILDPIEHTESFVE